MTDEITINATVKVDNASLSIPETGIKNTKFDQATLGGPAVGYQTIGTSEESVSLAELTTPGFCFMKNLEAAGGNFVTYGPDSTGMVAFGEMKATEVALFRLTRTSPTLVMQADTAAVKCQIFIIED